MHTARRLRSFSKRLCTLVLLCLVFAQVGSQWWYARWQTKAPAPAGESTRIIILHDGMLGWSRQYAASYQIPDSQFLVTPQRGSLRHQFRLDFGWTALHPGFWLHIPLLAPILLATAGVTLLWRWDLRSRRRAGHCPSCNYDHRGLAPNAPCPECGTANPKPPS